MSAGWLPFVLAGAALLLGALVGFFALVVFRRARTRAEEEAPAGTGTPSAAPPEGLEESFREGLKALHGYVPERGWRYRVPWVLVIGEAGSGKTTALAAAGLGRPFPQAPEDALAAKEGCRWSFFDAGVALDVAGDYVLREGGREGDAAGWRELLRQLRRHRGARALDAIVVTVPVSLLRGGATREEVAARGAVIFERLREAQQALGLRLPVYLLVTQCDRVPGFGSLVRQLPATVRGSIFGWSSPHPVDAAFDPEWVDEAFEEVTGELHEAQAELLADAADPDGVFVFPEALAAAAPLLQSFLHALFRDSAFHESYSLRGIYFTGAAPDDDASTLARGGDRPADGPQPVFLRDLLEEKVFAETGLARALPGLVRSRDRAVRLAQAALLALVVLGGAGLLFSHARLERRSMALRGTLQDVHRELRAVQSLRGGADAEVVALLEDIGSVNPRSVWSPLMPTSWASPLRRRVRRSMSAAVGDVLMPAMADSLQRRADRLAAPGVRLASMQDGADGAPAGGTADFTRYLAELRDLSVSVNRYNQMAAPGEGNALELRRLAAYVFHERLPTQQSAAQRRFIGRVVRAAEGEPLSLDDRTDRVLAHADGLARGVYGELIRRVDRLAGEVDDAASETGDPGLARMRDLSGEVDRLRGYVDEGDRFWLDPAADLSAPVRRILADIPDSPVVDARRVRAELPRRFAVVRGEMLADADATLATYNTLSGGAEPAYDALPAATGDAAPSALALRTALDRLQGRRFAGNGTRVPLRPLPAPAGMRAGWDLRVLDDALALHGEYQEFLKSSLGGLTPASQRLVRGLARVQLEGRMSEAVARARVFVPTSSAYGVGARERELSARVRGQQAAAQRVVRILGVYQELGLDASYRELGDVFVGEQLSLLMEVDGLLEGSGLYLPQDPTFGRWQGEHPISPAQFGAADAAELEGYLATQRGRVTALAQSLASPVLAELASPAMLRLLAGEPTAPVVERWQQIVAALDGYQAKAPGNTLADLEQFVRLGLDAAQVGDCAATVAPARSPSDFFAERRERLRSALLARCRALTVRQLRASWDRMRTVFDASLAGRFPFSDDPAADPALDADPAAVRAFFRLYDEVGPLRGEIARGAGGLGGPGSEAAEFLGRLAEVRPFLESVLGADTTGAAAYRVAAELRSARTREEGADQVAEWLLEVGAGRLTLRDSVGTALQWSPGDPIRLTLRWAEGSPVRPAPEGLPWNSRVRDRGATWYFGGDWALLRMLRQMAATPAELGASPGRVRHTLSLGVATIDSAGAPAGRARLFLRVRLRPGTGGGEVALPEFPTDMPPLGPAPRGQRGYGAADDDPPAYPTRAAAPDIRRPRFSGETVAVLTRRFAALLRVSSTRTVARRRRRGAR